jgi:hypothetical protein
MSTNFLGVGMNELDDLPSVSADEIICYLGFGLLAAGIVAGVLFVAVPLVRWSVKNLQKTTDKAQESPVLTSHFTQPDTV